MTYRFVGSYAGLGNGIVLERFGAAVELPESEAEEYIQACAALLPEAEFSTLGFTAEELETYYITSLHCDAPAEFIAKRDAAWAALQAHREKPIAAESAKE